MRCRVGLYQILSGCWGLIGGVSREVLRAMRVTESMLGRGANIDAAAIFLSMVLRILLCK